MAPTALKRLILVAGDDSLRAELRALLREGGYQVIGETGDGVSAVNMARALRPDLALVDVELRGMDGISAAEAISRQRSAPVLLLTQEARQQQVQRAVQAGVFGCVLKPVSAMKLITAMEIARQLATLARTTRRAADDLRDEITTQKLLERAKAILTDELGLTDAAALERINQLAERSGKTVRQVANGVIISTQAQQKGANH